MATGQLTIQEFFGSIVTIPPENVPALLARGGPNLTDPGFFEEHFEEIQSEIYRRASTPAGGSPPGDGTNQSRPALAVAAHYVYRETFGGFYDRLQRAIFDYCLDRSESCAQAEDRTHKAFLKFYSEYCHCQYHWIFDPGRCPCRTADMALPRPNRPLAPYLWKPYLFKTAAHVIIEEWRKASEPAPQAARGDPAQSIVDGADPAPKRVRRPQSSLDQLSSAGYDVPAGAVGPEEAAVHADLVERLRAALPSLPQGRRQCVLLHYWGGLTVEEIAARTGIPGGTVKSHLFLARKALRKELDPRPLAPTGRAVHEGGAQA